MLCHANARTASALHGSFVLPSTVSAADPTSGDSGKGFGTASLEWVIKGFVADSVSPAGRGLGHTWSVPWARPTTARGPTTNGEAARALGKSKVKFGIVTSTTID